MSLSAKTAPHSEDEGLSSVIAEINVTPLVDVMLVLLIIFMVTAPLMMSRAPLALPKAALQEMGKPREPLIVSFDLKGNYYLDTGGGHVDEIRYEQLAQRLHGIAAAQPDNLLYIRADRSVVFDKVRDLLKLAAESGFYKVSLMSEARP